MFPIDSGTKDFDARMVHQFDGLLEQRGLPWRLGDILPKVLVAGDPAGVLTEEGARLLDPSGELEPGVPLCPPEGDAGTGMTATNSVSVRTGNVSAGTSIFAMAVLEKELSKVYPEIDMVTTPAGLPVAMVHCNTCTSDLDAWVKLFGQLLQAAGTELPKWKLYDLLYFQALEGEGGLRGRAELQLLFRRTCDRAGGGPPAAGAEPGEQAEPAQLYAGAAVCGHGDVENRHGHSLLTRSMWCFPGCTATAACLRRKGVGQRLMAGALNVPVAVMETAGEGGPWGMALLAMYRKEREQDETLESYLEQKVFRDAAGDCVEPKPEDTAGFGRYIERYRTGLAVEQAAVESLR